ncbi:MAG: peptide deformylase [Chlamydiae bacterium]|nr:peptide deformylase [Chlamydiota bacterium]
MKLPIRYFGDPVLRQKAEPISEITPEIIQFAHDLVETMIAHHGVGLAASQVGKLLRIYVFRDEWLNDKGQYELGHPQIAINTTFSNPSKETEEMLEGCLSLPGLHVKVKRPKKIHIRYQNLKGEWVEQDLDGFLARVNMHENDHLNGVLHIDRASAKDRKAMESALQKIKQKYQK